MNHFPVMKCLPPIRAKVEFSFFRDVRAMEICCWTRCLNKPSQIYVKDFPLVNVYECGVHVAYYCSLCDYRIGSSMSNKFNGFNDREIRHMSWHFVVNHVFERSAGNYLIEILAMPALVNRYYFMNCGVRNYESRICNISSILKENPHFMHLLPGFSFSDTLDQFDEIEVPGWRLLSVIKSKPFSCLICCCRFESFPSNEVFNAHKCKS